MRYILVTSLEKIESKFALPSQNIIIEYNYNISPGLYTPVITSDKPKELQLFKFGLTPFWAKHEMNLFNARAEGDFNKEDNPAFRGGTGIIQKKEFRKSIRTQRCIVIASAFIEGLSNPGLSNPYLVYLRNHLNPFAFAGIWDIWFNPQTGKQERSFSIITTTANSLLRQIGNLRMPVILTAGESVKWINSGTELSQITCLLKRYDSKLMNGYPISTRIKNPDENDRQLIQPAGPRLLTEESAQELPKLEMHGYYHSKKRPTSSEPLSTMAERLESGKK